MLRGAEDRLRLCGSPHPGALRQDRAVQVPQGPSAAVTQHWGLQGLAEPCDMCSGEHLGEQLASGGVLAAGDLSFLCFPPLGEESLGKTRFFSKGVPWRPPGKSQSFQKELECQELSLRGLLILLYSPNHFLPRWRTGLPKHKLPSEEITASRLIRASFVCSVLG